MTLKKKEIIRVIDDYLEHCPGWRRWSWCTIYRSHGPVVQSIMFDRSSGDDYRPCPMFCSLITLRFDPRPDDRENTLNEIHDHGVLRHQPVLLANGRQGFKSCSESSIRLKFHAFYKPRLIEKLKTRLVPPLLAPLDVRAAVDRWRQLCPEKPADSDATALAALYAYLGDLDLARDLCRDALAGIYSCKYDRKGEDKEGAEWHEGHRPFMRHLLHWLDDGSYMERFEVMIKEARECYGIVETE